MLGLGLGLGVARCHAVFRLKLLIALGWGALHLRTLLGGRCCTSDLNPPSYTGKVLTESYGFQVASQSLGGQFAEQRTFIYSGNGSKFNVTMVFTDKAKNCAGTYSGAVIYYS